VRVATTSLMTVLLVATPVVASDNPFIGTSKHDLTRSKYNQTPPPGPRTVRISRADDGEKFIFAAKDKEVSPTKSAIPRLTMAKTMSVSGTPYADAVALRLVDRWTLEATWKKDGRAVRIERRVISESGKTMTTTSQRATEGFPADIMLYEKQ
jgi:hypothetical protein